MKSFQTQHRISALDWFCLRAIAFYQRRISPRKGWRCAYARLHGGPGCSGFVRDSIANRGLCAALPQIKTRFAQCKSAGQQLKSQHAGAIHAMEDQQNPQNRKSWFAAENWDCSACYACDLLDVFLKCGPGDGGCLDLPDCNCSPCD